MLFLLLFIIIIIITFRERTFRFKIRVFYILSRMMLMGLTTEYNQMLTVLQEKIKLCTYQLPPTMSYIFAGKRYTRIYLRLT